MSHPIDAPQRPHARTAPSRRLAGLVPLAFYAAAIWTSVAFHDETTAAVLIAGGILARISNQLDSIRGDLKTKRVDA